MRMKIVLNVLSFRFNAHFCSVCCYINLGNRSDDWVHKRKYNCLTVQIRELINYSEDQELYNNGLNSIIRLPATLYVFIHMYVCIVDFACVCLSKIVKLCTLIKMNVVKLCVCSCVSVYLRKIQIKIFTLHLTRVDF